MQRSSWVCLPSQFHFCSVAKFNNSLHNRSIPEFNDIFFQITSSVLGVALDSFFVKYGCYINTSSFIKYGLHNWRLGIPVSSCRYTDWYTYQMFSLLMNYKLSFLLKMFVPEMVTHIQHSGGKDWKITANWASLICIASSSHRGLHSDVSKQMKIKEETVSNKSIFIINPVEQRNSYLESHHKLWNFRLCNTFTILY